MLILLKNNSRYANIIWQCARIAQSVERPAVNRQVTGSSPVSGAIVCGRLVKRLNTPPFHGGIHGFESRTYHHFGSLAQLVEHLTLNQRVWGSSPQGITTCFVRTSLDVFFIS